MAELAFERFGFLPEVVRGTAVGAGAGASVHQFDLPGTLEPHGETYRPAASRGTLVKNYRSQRMREWAEWKADGDLSSYDMPLFANMALAGGVTATTPTNAVLTRQWIFTPNINADDIVTSTMYFGDPNQQMFQSAYGTIDEMTISGDRSSTEAVKVSLSGHGGPLQPNAPTAWKAMKTGSLMSPGNMQVWIDGPAGTIGTTDVTDLVVSAEHHWTNELSYKFGSGAGGLTSTLGYGRIGRAPRACEATFTMEFLDLVAYNEWKNADFLKTRVRYYGTVIETIVSPPVVFNAYVTVDLYGKFNAPGLAVIENTNRGWTFMVPSEMYATVGYDWRLTSQTSRTDLIVA